MNKGWIKLYRMIEDNFLYFSEPFTKAQAWIDMILLANHKTKQINIRGNYIDIKEGQLGLSEVSMSLRWKWSRNKVRRFLKMLETKQQIIQQKVHKITTVTTILNYSKYQNDTSGDTTEGHQTIQQKDIRRYTNKNVKNVKNVKKGDTNFFDEIKKNPAYKHINIEIELSRIDAWLLANPSRKKTKRFVVNWLNRIDVPLKPEKGGSPWVRMKA